MSLDPVLLPLPFPPGSGPDPFPADHGGTSPRPVPLSEVLAGSAAIITSACRVPPEARGALVERVVGMGDRRDVVLGTQGSLRRLPQGSTIQSPDARSTALLRAHHPALRPIASTLRAGTPTVEPSRVPAAEVRPLWPDPSAEAGGELLEPESWLPSPGQGVAVLLHLPDRAPSLADVPSDPDASAILQAERGVGGAFPGAVPLVRAQLFGEWISIHGVVLSYAGDRMVRARVWGHRDDPAGVAERLVEVLVDRGAGLLQDPRSP